MYAFGLLLWELLALAHPFADVHLPILREEVLAGRRPAYHVVFSEDEFRMGQIYQTLIDQCLQADPRNRPTMVSFLFIFFFFILKGGGVC